MFNMLGISKENIDEWVDKIVAAILIADRNGDSLARYKSVLSMLNQERTIKEQRYRENMDLLKKYMTMQETKDKEEER